MDRPRSFEWASGRRRVCGGTIRGGGARATAVLADRPAETMRVPVDIVADPTVADPTVADPTVADPTVAAPAGTAEFPAGMRRPIASSRSAASVVCFGGMWWRWVAVRC